MRDLDRDWIDNASYKDLLTKWRFSPAGDPFFVGETGDYYCKKIEEKRRGISHDEQVKISKEVGWK